MESNLRIKAFGIEKSINSVVIACIVIGIIQTLIFALMVKNINVAIVHLFITLFFVSAFYSIKSQQIELAIVILHLAINLNILYMIYEFGWDYGYQIHIIVLIGLYYVNSFKNKIIAHIIVLMEVMLYVALYFASKIYDYSLNNQIIICDCDMKEFISFSNCFFGSLILLFFTHMVSNNHVKTIMQQEQDNKILALEVQKDPLTGLNTRTAFIESIKNNTSQSYDGLFYFAIIDIDFFKKINDKYGHIIGDEVLKKLAIILQDIFTRQNVCRWGGEEFAIFGIQKQSDLLDNFGFLGKLEHLKTEFENSHFTVNKEIFNATISIGCVGVGDIRDIEKNINLADECLYEAKNTGRNKIICKIYSKDGKRFKRGGGFKI